MANLKQSGPCAFANSCIVPGPRWRMPGTNRQFCPAHAVAIAASAATPSGGAETAVRVVSRGGHKRTWATYVGIVSQF